MFEIELRKHTHTHIYRGRMSGCKYKKKEYAVADSPKSGGKKTKRNKASASNVMQTTSEQCG